MRTKSLQGTLLLLLAAVIWGAGFVFQKLGMNYVGPLTFGAAKFLLGAVVLLPVIFVFAHVNKKKRSDTVYSQEKKYHKKDLIISSLLCGLFVAVGTYFQQLGLIYTTVGKAGFITALYVVLVPILGLFLHKRPGKLLWFGVGLATLGLYLLCVKEGFTIQKGDAIELAGTIFWALQILTVDAYSSRTDSLVFSSLQLFVAGILSTVAALIFEDPTIGAIIACKVPLLYAGIMSIGIATALQVAGQKTNRTDDCGYHIRNGIGVCGDLWSFIPKRDDEFSRAYRLYLNVFRLDIIPDTKGTAVVIRTPTDSQRSLIKEYRYVEKSTPGSIRTRRKGFCAIENAGKYSVSYFFQES